MRQNRCFWPDSGPVVFRSKDDCCHVRPDPTSIFTRFTLRLSFLWFNIELSHLEEGNYLPRLSSDSGGVHSAASCFSDPHNDQ